MATVKIKIEKEYAEELVETLQRILAFDDVSGFLSTDDYYALDALENTLMFKLGRVL